MLPTGLTYSSLAKRLRPSTASGTCRVGCRVFLSSSRRVARRNADHASGLSGGILPGSVSPAVADRLAPAGSRSAMALTGRDARTLVDVAPCRSGVEPNLLFAVRGMFGCIRLKSPCTLEKTAHPVTRQTRRKASEGFVLHVVSLTRVAWRQRLLCVKLRQSAS